MTVGARLLVAALVMASCAAPIDPPGPMPGTVRDDVMTIEPKVVRPGDALNVSWPAEDDRGVAYRMGRQAESGEWYVEYILYIGDGAPGTWQPAAREAEIPAMAIGGPGPDRLRTPDTAEPGIYRICTWDDPGTCATVEIRAP